MDTAIRQLQSENKQKGLDENVTVIRLKRGAKEQAATVASLEVKLSVVTAELVSHYRALYSRHGMLHLSASLAYAINIVNRQH